MRIVNLRVGGPEYHIAGPMRAMRQMQDEGLAAYIGVSTVSAGQLHVARDIAPVVCVQNHYNLVHRDDDAMIDALAGAGIAYVPYFPLGGFTPLQAKELTRVAAKMRRTPLSVALAWLLQRSPNILRRLAHAADADGEQYADARGNRPCRSRTPRPTL